MRKYAIETVVMLVFDAFELTYACWTSLPSPFTTITFLLDYDIITFRYVFLLEHKPSYTA
jgi:hypothetical protein